MSWCFKGVAEVEFVSGESSEMQVAGRSSTVVRKHTLSHSLSMYTAPPQEELTIDDFEMFSLDRLQLLRGLELLKTRGFVDKELAEKIKQVSAVVSISILYTILRIFS